MTASETTRLLPENPPDLVSATKGTEDPSRSSRPQLLITIGLCLSIFCVSLDQTVLATAIPRITDEFQSLKNVGWYGSSFLFVFTATQMMWGKLYQGYTTKRMFLLGLAIFELGSLLCGIAPSSATLVAGRSIAGLGAGSINSGALFIITDTIPLNKRPVYMGFLGCVHAVTKVTGPLLGGLLTDHASWRWCFYINLPMGLVTAIVILFLVPTNQPKMAHSSLKDKIKSMDLPGSLLLICGTVALLLALQWGGSEYAWDDWRIRGLFMLSGIMLAAFAGVQVWAGDKATIPLRILCNRDMLSITLWGIFNGGAMIVFIYYLPIWYQAVEGFSATKSGLMTLPTQLGLVFCSLAGGIFVSLVGYYTPFLIASSVISTLGAALLSTLHPSSNLISSLIFQVLLSLGIGLGSQNSTLVPQVAVQKEDVVIAISSLTFVQALSSSVSLVIGQSVFHNRLVENLRVSAPSIDPSMVEKGVTMLRDTIPPEMLADVLGAFSRAITDTFHVAVVMCAFSLVGSASLRWKSIREKTVEE
ncbi:putative efflux pump antibiotic resistance protein [Aspergillus flavus]|uniref:Efflux pump antibiotic resistance protein n=2 Tax=Aspergillus subgen. Circumdati TaxID=2720871 RepID=A0A7G5KBZ0_ASPFN|nr:uncharacterized protein G4B84_008775 [Aspergillus flavus NRRL3357]KAJ1712944.1 efflux pump antibiotic resistance protein [Aspergillus flavus]OOO05249.1 major facilitator superfamily MFS_1 [Aspergillus oryzae]KAF7616252.1 hypothetical protein AFLA_009749 [Aspergillus flavus NRRL3357]QMW33344.1 hypothetical protein G4B84_008775 [Aspergillus flavus NRRL3357]QMW45382.1 hypothetical protein G4B11_008802 [Aspergillus flavus]